MDSRPPNLLLLLTAILHFSQCTGGQHNYIIDTVGLTVLPRGLVPSGTLVTLRCLVSISHDNTLNLNHTFQFTRDDVPIHSTTTTEDSAVYELNPARAADSGSYACQVTVKEKSRLSWSQKLDVTGMQTPTLHVSKTDPFEGEDLTATCSAPEEKGTLIFRYYQKFRSGESLMLKQLALAGSSSKTTLVLRQIGDSLLYCDYEINLISGTRRSNRSNVIQVIVKGLYISPIMNVLPSSDVYEGDILEIYCKVVSALNNTEVFLTKDRRILKKAPISLSHRWTAQEGDSGEFVCKAVWGSMQKETYQKVSVKELFSKPFLKVEPLDIFEGDRFRLTCSVDIYYPERIDRESMQFFIYKDNVSLNSSDTYAAVANAEKNGNYSCKVQSSSVAHSLVKESQTIAVKAKIPVSKPMVSVEGGTLVLGKPFQLVCHSDSGTPPITYTLHGPGGLNERRTLSKPGEKAVFNSSAIFKTSDLNSFLCHAKNSQHKPPMIVSGQQLQRSTDIIEPVSKPALIVLPSPSYISEGQIMTLECTVQRGTPPISFTWYYADTNTALHSKTSRKLQESYSITDIKREQGGGYYCLSTNPANETKQSYTVSIGVTLAGWKKGLIAVVCILVILVLMLVCAFKRRLRQFKRRRTGKLSVKSASTKAERLSLTQAEVIEANATPAMIGKSVWSEHVSSSESDDQNSVTAAEPQYTEVQTKQADPNCASEKEGTDTAHSEGRNSHQGVPEAADGASVEYAQLNQDTDHHDGDGNAGDGNAGDGNDVDGNDGDGNHADHSAQEDHTVEIDNSGDAGAPSHEE